MTPFLRFFIIGLPLVLFANVAAAFSVIHVDYGRNFFFVFDGGTKQGVQEGMTACVDDEMGWELFCGKIERVKTTVAAVEAPDQYEAYFDQGLHVRVMELGGPAGHKRVGEDGLPLRGESNEEAPDSGPPNRGPFWSGGLVTTPVLPYSATFPDFSVDARFNGKGTIWQPGPDTRSSRVGFRFGRRQPWSKKWDH